MPEKLLRAKKELQKKNRHYWKSLPEQKSCTPTDKVQHTRRNKTVFENNNDEKSLT